MPTTGNLFADLPAGALPAEDFETLLASGDLRIERIVSTGQASAPGFWYEQAHGEWVVVLAGQARLRVEHEADARTLEPGDWVHLPPGCRHRVEWTDPAQPTVWLAVHYPVDGRSSSPPD